MTDHPIREAVAPLVVAMLESVTLAACALGDGTRDAQYEALQRVITTLRAALDENELAAVIEADDARDQAYARWHAEAWRVKP